MKLEHLWIKILKKLQEFGGNLWANDTEKEKKGT